METSPKFVHLAQGAAGVIERDHDNGFSFYTDRLESCRAYVFECERGLIMLHDSGQLILDEVCQFVSSYGAVQKVHFVAGVSQTEPLHNRRLPLLVAALNIKSEAINPKQTNKSHYHVAFHRPSGQLVDAPSANELMPIRDPSHAKREARSIIWDYFSPPQSESVPLDIQYTNGSFTTPPPGRPLKELLEVMRSDAEFGLMEAVVLYAHGTAAGYDIPTALFDFVKQEGLAQAAVYGLGKFEDPTVKAAAMKRLAALPIYD